MTDLGVMEILVVEDSSEDLELMLRALRASKLSNKIQVARDGAEAMDFVFREGQFAERSNESSPKLILLDLKLPKIDGLEVLKRIKSDPQTSSTPVVVLTSSREQRDVIESYRLGVNSYIVKPANFDAFAAAVTELGLYWLLLNQPPEGER